MFRFFRFFYLESISVLNRADNKVTALAEDLWEGIDVEVFEIIAVQSSCCCCKQPLLPLYDFSLKEAAYTGKV